MEEELKLLFNISDAEMEHIKATQCPDPKLEELARSKGFGDDDLLEVKVRAYVEARSNFEDRN